MGREISTSHFRHHDFHRFERCMVQEMKLLHDYFSNSRFAESPLRIGLELETWLTDSTGKPQPENSAFLRLLNSPDVVPELSQFNVEFNVAHQSLSQGGLRALESELEQTWSRAAAVANEMNLVLTAIGILPTIQPEHLSIKTMSELSRYQALNEQVLRLRRGRPVRLKIDGPEPLLLDHDDVMLEAAATSLQVHYQVPLSQSVRYYNAAVIASGPVTGVAANSPLLFGNLLWAESRIPLFEMSVDLGGPFPRVHFGCGYAGESFEEFFLINRSCHPVLLPIEIEEAAEFLPHVRLHNGTIWRWNRPLIGFEKDGQPHLRVEHRIMPAGPTLIDMMANIAFTTGLIHNLAQSAVPPERILPFDVVEKNFQMASRFGLDAELKWLDQLSTPLPDLVLQQLLPCARAGLESLEIDSEDRDRYLNVIEDRVESGQNGAVWQTRFVQKYGRDLAALTRVYTQLQQSGDPVHEWEI